MGIRVTKAIGFGMRDFIPPVGWRERHTAIGEMTIGDFLPWMAKHEAAIEAFAPEEAMLRRTILSLDIDDSLGRRSDPLGHHVLWDDEFGFKDALLFIPLGQARYWHRYDDDIDWSEETQEHAGENRFVSLKGSLHPHEKGLPPLSVAALALYLGVPHVWPELQESMYVTWG